MWYALCILIGMLIGIVGFVIAVLYSAHLDYKETNEHNRKRQQLSKPTTNQETEAKYQNTVKKYL